MQYITETIQQISVMAIPVLAALTCHEVAHGWVAYRMGDPTAKQMGRLTLNPLAHLDPVGTLAFVMTRMIGWAKPVPVNPNNFKNPRKDMIWVAIAGPLMNIFLAIVSSILLKMIPTRIDPAWGNVYLIMIVPIYKMLQYSVMINVGLAIFNVIPIPPLDGGRIMTGILPVELAYKYSKVEPYGFILLIIFIMSGMVDRIIIPVIYLAVKILI